MSVGWTFLSARIAKNDKSADSQTCHPEEARPARGSSAGRLTKDLLRHRLMHELLVMTPTRKAARLRRHGHGEEW